MIILEPAPPSHEISLVDGMERLIGYDVGMTCFCGDKERIPRREMIGFIIMILVHGVYPHCWSFLSRSYPTLSEKRSASEWEELKIEWRTSKGIHPLAQSFPYSW